MAEAASDEPAAPCTPEVAGASPAPIEVPFADDAIDLHPGPPVRVLDVPGYYVNDHTFVHGPDGWHLFGIYGAQPRPEGQEETDFVHAVATVDNPAEWGAGTFSLPPSPRHIALTALTDLAEPSATRETHIWAPHAVAVGDGFQMFFHAGGPGGEARIASARSLDLFTWERAPAAPLFSDICVARDPMVVRDGARWLMYYTRCGDECSLRSGVAVRTSEDGGHWSEPSADGGMALTLGWSTPMVNSGFTESPFVFHRGDYWYLSVTAYPIDWAATLLFRSRDPLHFDDRPNRPAHGPRRRVGLEGRRPRERAPLPQPRGPRPGRRLAHPPPRSLIRPRFDHGIANDHRRGGAPPALPRS